VQPAPKLQRGRPESGTSAAAITKQPTNAGTVCLCFCGATIATVDEHIRSANRGVGA